MGVGNGRMQEANGRLKRVAYRLEHYRQAITLADVHLVYERKNSR